MEWSNVKLVSDGLPQNTAVLVDGVRVEGVTSVTWTLKSNEDISVLTLEIEGAEAEIDALRIVIDGIDEDDGR